jgi:cathepsin A (carboxypeptidase C)
MAFALAGDEGSTTQPQVLYLLDSGIDVLIYQGMLDLACNTAVSDFYITELVETH